MALMDKLASFSYKQAITASANSTDVYDLKPVVTPGGQMVTPVSATPNNGAPIFDYGQGGIVNLLIQVVEDFAAAGAATLQVQLVQADSADLVTGAEVLQETAAVPKATLVAGYQFRIRDLPHGVTKRYLGLKYVVGTGPMTAGKVTAAFVIDKHQGYRGL